MDSHYPLAAKRLYALMGDKMLDFPPYFIERLERRLEAFETSRSNKHVVVPLRLISDIDCGAAAADDSPEEPQRAALIAVPVRTLQALASIFEILHAVHLGKQDVQSEGCVTSLMVEGLILSGRATWCGHRPMPCGASNDAPRACQCPRRQPARRRDGRVSGCPPAHGQL